MKIPFEKEQESAPVDARILLSLSAGEKDPKRDRVAESIVSFLAVTKGRIELLQSDAGKGGSASVARIARLLAVDCETLGALPMARLAAEIERQALEGELSSAAVLVTSLTDEFERVRIWLAGRLGPLAAGWPGAW